MNVCTSHVTTTTLTTPSWLHCATHGTICPSGQGTWYTWIIIEHTLRCKKPRWEVWTVWSVCVAQKSDRGTHVCNTLVHATITGLQTQNSCTMPGYVPLLYVHMLRQLMTFVPYPHVMEEFYGAVNRKWRTWTPHEVDSRSVWQTPKCTNIYDFQAIMQSVAI